MGKFSGFVFGTTTAVIIGYYLLSPYYSPIVNWFSPYFGSSVALMLGLFFLLLGDPLIYPIVIFSWVAVGIVVGLSVRRVKGSIVSMISVYFACWAILLVGILGAVIGLLPSLMGTMGGSPPGGTSPLPGLPSLPPIPTPPSGTNILTLLSEPVISQFFQTLLSLLPRLGTISGSSSLTQSYANLFTTYALPLILTNMLTFAVSLITASLVAHYTRKYIVSLEDSPSVKPRRMASNAVALAALVVALSIIISGLSGGTFHAQAQNGIGSTQPSTLHASSGMGIPYAGALVKFAEMKGAVLRLVSSHVPGQTASPVDAIAHVSTAQGAYEEASTSLISSDGNLYSGFAFASNYSLPQSSITGNSQVGLSLLLLDQNLVDMPLASLLNLPLNSSGSSGFPVSPSSLIPLIPTGLLFISINPGPLSAQKVADEQVSYYSNVTGEHFSLIVEMANISSNTPLSGLFPGGSSASGNASSPVSSGTALFIYGTNAPAEKSASGLAGSYLPTLHPDGLVGSLSSQLISGSLFSATKYGSCSGLLAVGYAGLSGFLPQNGTAGPSSLFSLPSGSISFCFGLFYKSDFAFGSGFHSLPLSAVIGSSPVSFSPTASLSSLEILTPSGYNDLNAAAFPSGFNGTVFTDNLQYVNGSVNSSGWTVINVSAQNQISPSTTLTFSSPLPPEVVISSSSSATGDTLSVSAVVSNMGNSTVNGLSVFFPGIQELQSGLSTSLAGMSYQNTSALSPGQSFDAHFSFGVPHSGVYVLPRMTYSFSSGAHTFVLLSPVTQVSVAGTLLFTMFPPYLGKALYGLISYYSPSTPYIEILVPSYLLPTLFMALAIYSEYSSFRKWRTKRGALTVGGVREAAEPDGQPGTAASASPEHPEASPDAEEGGPDQGRTS